MATLMTNDEREYYRSQVKLAKAQKKSLKNQDAILREQVKISKEQTEYSNILMWATVVLALAGSAQVIYYFEIFSQEMIKDIYDVIALIILGIILISIVFILTRLISILKLKSNNE